MVKKWPILEVNFKDSKLDDGLSILQIQIFALRETNEQTNE